MSEKKLIEGISITKYTEAIDDQCRQIRGVMFKVKGDAPPGFTVITVRIQDAAEDDRILADRNGIGIGCVDRNAAKAFRKRYLSKK